MEAKIIIPTHPADLVKEILKERGISQREFAKLANMRPSHLNDILNKRRRITDEFALEVQKWLGLSAKSIVEQQAAYKLTHPDSAQDSQEEGASMELEAIDEFVNIKVLLKYSKKKYKSSLEKLHTLRTLFNIDGNLMKEYDSIASGCFRKSAKKGLDERMIATWIALAKASVADITPSGSFDYSDRKALCDRIRAILHRNEGNLMRDLTSILDSYGIVFRQVDKVDRASIDGFSFFSQPSTPCIVVTCRYNRIDNLAFTIMHELGHIYLKHTTPNKSRINVDTRSINDETEDRVEKAADEFAAQNLITPSSWNSAPQVPLNPYKIQSLYSEWAEKLNFNKWIVLGHLSHITGMYKFKSDISRQISGGKEVKMN